MVIIRFYDRTEYERATLSRSALLAQTNSHGTGSGQTAVSFSGRRNILIQFEGCLRMCISHIETSIIFLSSVIERASYKFFKLFYSNVWFAKLGAENAEGGGEGRCRVLVLLRLSERYEVK